MGKVSGLNERLFVGSADLSGDVGALSKIAEIRNQQIVTGLNKSAQERINLLRDGSLAYTAFFDADSEHPVLSALAGVPTVYTWCTAPTAGAVTASLVATQTDYPFNRGADGSLVLSPTAESAAYGIEWGNLLTNGAQAFATDGSGTAIDDVHPVFGLTSTAHGLAFYVHALSLGSGNPVLTVEDSADNVTFAAVSGATTTFGTPESDRVQVGGTVRRYLKLVVSGTFTDLVVAVAVVRYLNNPNTTAG